MKHAKISASSSSWSHKNPQFLTVLEPSAYWSSVGTLFASSLIILPGQCWRVFGSPQLGPMEYATPVRPQNISATPNYYTPTLLCSQTDLYMSYQNLPQRQALAAIRQQTWRIASYFSTRNTFRRELRFMRRTVTLFMQQRHSKTGFATENLCFVIPRL